MKKNLRRLSILVSAQTAWNLNKLAEICGYGNNVGKVVDKLVREKIDRKSTRLNSSHSRASRMPSSA